MPAVPMYFNAQKKLKELGITAHAKIPAPERLRQDCCKFKAS